MNITFKGFLINLMFLAIALYYFRACELLK